MLGFQSIPWDCPQTNRFSFGLVPPARSNSVQCSLPGTHFYHSAHSDPVAQAAHAFCLGTMFTTEEGSFFFEPVTDDVNATISASRSECMDCALEAVERVGRAVYGHLKGLVVVVSAGFASCHDDLPFAVGQPAPIGRVPQTRVLRARELCGSLAENGSHSDRARDARPETAATAAELGF